LIGLAVMGQNLILNMNDHGYTVVAYNRTVSKVDEFLNDAAKGRELIIGAKSIEEMAGLLKRPRKIMLMVKAGKAVDDFIETCCPTWNPATSSSTAATPTSPTPSAAPSTWQGQGPALHRHRRFRRRGRRAFRPLHHARRQPRGLAPGEGHLPGHLRQDPDGEPCCDWIGEDGAGHYVKMTHNGIEYGDMQLICEAYQLMKEGLGMTRRDARGLHRVE
jgi:6-phosphogluconate dehydrogenase